MTDNLALWNRHRTPHKDALKEFTKRGGFKGTAIDPMWAIRAATEEWGSMGETWGYEDVREDVRTLSDTWILHTITIRLWYLNRDSCGIYASGSTWLVSPCKKWVDGVQVDSVAYDDEAPKKSRTDALTKALSWLGFGADIYMGMHGSKYSDLQQDEDVIITQNDVAEEPDYTNLMVTTNLVKRNIKDAISLVGEERYKAWHDRVLSNFYDVDSIEKLSADELAGFADKQVIKIKEHKG